MAKEPFILSLAKNIVTAPNDYISSILDKIGSGGAPKAEAAAPKPFSIRGVPIDKDTFDSEIRPIVYGEVSNRDASKKELEARVILNTGINRASAYTKKGDTKMDLRGVFTAPNQYQAYGGDQYKLYKSGTGQTLDLEKKKEVDGVMDKLWSEIESGSFADDTNNAYFYKHNADHSISYDDTKPLFK